MNLVQHLATFVRIADAGNISRAARSLGLSAPMASRHLRALEKEFGVVLMRRSTRRVDLTEAGTELLGRARRLLAGLDETRDALRPSRLASGPGHHERPGLFPSG
jgi:DNA-binding transcriptional LysR family regulator